MNSNKFKIIIFWLLLSVVQAMPSSRFIVKNALMNPIEEIPISFRRITTYRETRIGVIIDNFNENEMFFRRTGRKNYLSESKEHRRTRNTDRRKLKKRHYHIPNYITVSS